jgi:transketolase
MDAPIERRPSVARLTAALGELLPDTEAQGLVLAICLIFARHMRLDAADPAWPDRDRLLIDSGLAGMDNALSALAGIGFGPCHYLEPPLGLAVGTSLAERLLAARFGRSLVDHRTWVLLTEACLPEGAVLEAAQLAAAWKLSRLVALVSVEHKDAPGLAAFAAAGWSVRRVASTDGAEIAAAVSAALRAQRPTLLACLRAGNVRDKPDDATLAESRAAWPISARRGLGVRRAWLRRRARHASRADFEQTLGGRLPPSWHQAFFGAAPLAAGDDTVSTETSVRRSLARLIAATPELTLIAPPSPGYGSLSRGLADTAAGIALHGGIVPVLAERLAALTALDAALRLSADSGHRLVALLEEAAEGGPGRRAALRALPSLPVYRPADASEAMECAELAFRAPGPSVLLLSRAPAELLADRPSRTRCVKGGYVLVDAIGPRASTLIASGPEVALALLAQDLLAERELETAVVSLPCWHAFFRQEPEWRERVLGQAPRIGLEPGGGFGWDAILGQGGLFIGSATLPPPLWAPDQRAAAASRIAEIVARHVERQRPIWTGQEASPKRPAFERPG